MEMDQEYTDDLKQLLTSAKHPRAIELLEKAIAEVTDDTTTTQLNGTSPSKSVEMTEELTMKPFKKQKDGTLSMARITNYGWDQSDKFVKIYISDINGIDGLEAENIRSGFNQSSIKVELLGINGKNYGLTINNLFGAIVPEQCTVKVKSGMVIIGMRKARKTDWQFITAREKKLQDSKVRKPPKLDGDDKEDPSQGLMKMMKQMYEDGDDDMKRTIAKSWYESQEKKKSGNMDI